MECTDLEMGFNAANETMVNMITAGIIDPTKVMPLKKVYGIRSWNKENLKKIFYYIKFFFQKNQGRRLSIMIVLW